MIRIRTVVSCGNRRRDARSGAAMSALPLLLISHPGHELMVHGWLADARPRVMILTDGSGRNGASRIHSSERIIGVANAERGSIWGICSDRELYDRILDGEITFFTALAQRVADEIVATKPSYVAGDAREGINPTHDLCRAVIDTAVRISARQGAIVANYAFTLFAPHGNAPRHGTICKNLTDDELALKVSTARAYPELVAEAEATLSGTRVNLFERDPDLAAKIDAATAGMNEHALAIECLAPADALPYENDEKPFYEIYGERHVAAGVYQRAIRYREHIAPIEQALRAL